jgi:hypothetical protein
LQGCISAAAAGIENKAVFAGIQRPMGQGLRNAVRTGSQNDGEKN